VHRVCPLDRIAAVITDGAGDPGAAGALASAGVTLLRAGTPETAPRQATAHQGLRPVPSALPATAHPVVSG
jgi:hypothetical protein